MNTDQEKCKKISFQRSISDITKMQDILLVGSIEKQHSNENLHIKKISKSVHKKCKKYVPYICTPKRLVMVHIKLCDYSGMSNEKICLVYMPNDIFTGIACKEKYVEQAKRDIIAYCDMHDVYSNVKHVDELNSIEMLRSNGKMEEGWTVTRTTFCNRTEKILVYTTNGYWKKVCSLQDLCKFNNFDYDDILSKLRTKKPSECSIE